MLMAGLLLTFLMALAALIVDLGNAMQIRRKAQSSADAVALAGAQDLPTAQTVVTTVKTYAIENYGVPVSAWVGCTDADALTRKPDLTANTNSCISINEAFTKVRVRMPTTDVKTAFGKVIGVSTVAVSASATAQALLRSDDRIIPAAVTASMGMGNLCIENSGNNTSCAARSSGNFGSLDSPRVNIYKPSASEDPNSLRVNYAMSIDHDISIWSTGNDKVCSGDIKTPCTLSNVNTSHTANHLNVYTGNAVPPVTEGFINGFTINTDDLGSVSFCGRLQRPDLTTANFTEPHPGDCNPSGPTITVLNTTITARHVYAWLHDWAKQVFYPEVWDYETDHAIAHGSIALTDSRYSNGDVRLDCFVKGYSYNYTTGAETVPTCTGVALPTGRTYWWGMLKKDVVSDPRFGMIPVLDAWPNGGSTAARVVDFQGLFLYRTYTGSQKLQAMDGWVYEPALIETESGVPGLQFGFQLDPVVHLVD